jgi:hypothetical protein
MKYEVFISHASEDKEGFVAPLARRLQQSGLNVWYDDFSLRVGDSLSESINLGLRTSMYGIVVLSPDFFSKSWPKRELGALIAREDGGHKVILPIWHRLTRSDVVRYYPLLADKLAVRSCEGMDVVVQKILAVVRPELLRQKAISLDRLARLSEQLRDYLLGNIEVGETDPRFLQQAAVRSSAAASVLANALVAVSEASDPGDILRRLEQAESQLLSALMYCVKCREATTTPVFVEVTLKNGKPATKGLCPRCRTVMFRIGG